MLKVLVTKKKWKSSEVRKVLTNPSVVIISQHIRVSKKKRNMRV